MSEKELSRKPRTGRNRRFLTKAHQCHGCGEVAGDTTAAFAAVICCPCALLHLAALAFVKLPAGLCKKTLKKIRGKVKAKKQIQDKPADDKMCEDCSQALTQDELLGSNDARGLAKTQVVVNRVSTEECWEQVTGKGYVGFWRNYSFE